MQLGLIETDHLGSVMLQEIIYDLLFGLRVQTSDIDGDQFELLPVRSHIDESPVDMSSVSDGECISPVLSVIGSTPTVRLRFMLGLLLLL
jgi:hypothetical protein